MGEVLAPASVGRLVCAWSMAVALALGAVACAPESDDADVPRDEPLPPLPQPPVDDDRPVEEAPDAITERTLQELDEFVAWLEVHEVDGYIGEVGWPAGDGYDDERWNSLAERWFSRAREAGLWVTVWGAGGWWPSDYELSPYIAADGDIDRPGPQARVLESQSSGPPVGVNISGAEFGAPRGRDEHDAEFSNARPGKPGRDYRYESSQSFEFLADRGIEVVRLAFRWERIQPVRWGPLDGDELDRLRGAIRRAGDAGLSVILNVHNYGGYFVPHPDGGGTREPVGGEVVPVDAFIDLWARLSEAFVGDDAVVAYGLMNEPHTLHDDPAMSARRWEDASQAVVTALRDSGDDTLVMVPGANWSAVRRWSGTHPEPWIDDPADNFRYQAHHYFDPDHSGRYALDYEQQLLQEAG
jgi:hypothetical protein